MQLAGIRRQWSQRWRVPLMGWPVALLLAEPSMQRPAGLEGCPGGRQCREEAMRQPRRAPPLQHMVQCSALRTRECDRITTPLTSQCGV